MLDTLYSILSGMGFKEPLHSPITHMPVGLVVGALIFFIIALVFKKKELQMTARHVSILAFVFAFPTILFGVMDWIHFYHAVLFTPIKIKMALAAIVLLVLGAGIILGSEIKVPSFAMTLLYSAAFVCVIGLGYFGSGIIYGRGLEMKPKIMIAPKEKTRLPTEKIGFDERQGDSIPLDLVFTLENGRKAALGSLIDGPTVLSFVYYRCPNACDLLLTGIAAAVRPYGLRPADAPNLITISIDDAETPADALKARAIAFESIQGPYPADRWHFLTGDAGNIRKAADAAGFGFAKKGKEFDHPLGLIILSPKGKIVRYILGNDFLPVDLKISLMEASNGIVGPTISRVLRFCFSYDQKNHRLVFNILRVSATVIFILLAVFAVYLIASVRKRRPQGNG